MIEQHETRVLYLNSNEILMAEYEYIVQTTLAANEDRARVTSYYFVTVGSLIAAALGLKFEISNSQYLYIVFTFLFGTLSLLSILIQLHLVKLRLAWFDGISALNQIKSYYLRHSKPDDLGSAFRWSAKSTPPIYKLNSISFIMSLQVAFLGSLMFGAFCLVLGLSFGKWWLAFSIVLGFIYFILQVIVYWRLLAINGLKRR